MKLTAELFMKDGKCMPLSFLPTGKKARVRELTSNGISRRRMLDLGLIWDTEVEALQKAHQATRCLPYPGKIALRSEEASR